MIFVVYKKYFKYVIDCLLNGICCFLLLWFCNIVEKFFFLVFISYLCFIMLIEVV